jgi:hypothetical protein
MLRSWNGGGDGVVSESQTSGSLTKCIYGPISHHGSIFQQKPSPLVISWRRYSALSPLKLLTVTLDSEQ